MLPPSLLIRPWRSLNSCWHRRCASSFLLPSKEDGKRERIRRRDSAAQDPNQTPLVIDNNPHSSTTAFGATKKDDRLPPLPHNWQEFPPKPTSSWEWFNLTSPRALRTARIVKMALSRVMEPPTLHFMAAAGCATLGIGALEGTLMCQAWPFTESAEAGRFVLRYAVQNLFPSVVWETADASLTCRAMGLDPSTLLRDLKGETQESAILLLQVHLLSTSRFFFAGFMMIAQLFRAATISMESFDYYEQRIAKGREPPLTVQDGLIVRLCGRDSHVSEVSLQRMGSHLLPVFEYPERVKFLVRQHSHHKTVPVYWCVPPGLYWRSYSWENFPVSKGCFLKGLRQTTESTNTTTTTTEDRVLVLEADATNGNDPLTIREMALDLTLEDASQGFRRILHKYRQEGLVAGRDFRTLRVYLGNSMETTQTGGGHSYTIRHRIRYAKEMDVLIDSRAPVLRKILEWCESVAYKDRKIFFQTLSREYFLNLQILLKQYGYEIYDPLDLRMLHTLRQTMKDEEISKTDKVDDSPTSPISTRSLVGVLLEDPNFVEEELEDHGDFLNRHFFPPQINVDKLGGKEIKKESSTSKNNAKEMLRKVARLAKLPRLVHMETTAETVNAVEALIAAGEVDASSCCALLDRQEGVAILEANLENRSGFVQSRKNQWQRKARATDDNGESKSLDPYLQPSLGLQIICSSTIHDDILRHVRWWARLGYQAADIQREIDIQYQEILQKSHTVQKQLTDTTKKETPPSEKTETPSSKKETTKEASSRSSTPKKEEAEED